MCLQSFEALYQCKAIFIIAPYVSNESLKLPNNMYLIHLSSYKDFEIIAYIINLSNLLGGKKGDKIGRNKHNSKSRKSVL